MQYVISMVWLPKQNLNNDNTSEYANVDRKRSQDQPLMKNYE